MAEKVFSTLHGRGDVLAFRPACAAEVPNAPRQEGHNPAMSKTTLVPLLVLLASLSRADLAYGNFGAGLGYRTDSGTAISSPTSAIGHHSSAMQFTSATTGELTTISFPAYRVAGDGLLQIGLYEDASDVVGMSLATFSAVAPLRPATVLTVGGVGGVSLVAGRKYWVGMVALDDTDGAWNYADPLDPGVTSPEFDTAGAFTTYLSDRSAFRVETRPVPEPASVAALASGALGFLRRRRAA